MDMEVRPKVVVPGGGGYLGTLVASHFLGLGWEVVILSRSLDGAPQRVDVVCWDGKTLDDWAQTLEGASAVVNLSGRSVNCRYNERNRQEIYDSRLHSTRVLGEAISRCATPPPVWINAASATIYRDAQDRPMDEATGEIGSGFSVDVCQKWEQTLWDAPTPHTRKVALRSALVLGAGPGGVLEPFVRLVRLGLGGQMGPGSQYVSWVHSDDFVRSIAWVIEHGSLEGPVNCAAPHPVTNAEFMCTLRRVCRCCCGLPASRWMLEIGALLMETETELILKSRRVVPARLVNDGFYFRFPTLEPALADLLGR